MEPQQIQTQRRPARPLRLVRRAALFIGAGVLVLVVTAMAFLPPASPRRLIAGTLETGDPSFYAVPSSVSPAPPGTLVRSERLYSAPTGAVGWRILYDTKDVSGADIVVSGVVTAPDQPAASGTRTVVGWGHPTTGATASCAPSNGVDPFLIIEGIAALLHDGYVVAAPDFPGLGVAGRSSYLIGTSEGNSLLDAVRAARQLPTGAGADVLLWGQSQGGHAVLFAAQGVSGYAPELHLRSVAVAAPAADLGTLLAAHMDDVSGVTIGSYAFSAYQQVYASSYPGLTLTSILTDAGAAVTPTMANLCLFGSLFELHSIARPLIGGYMRSSPATTPPWSQLLAANTPGSTRISVPLLVAQGSADQLVVPAATRQFASNACAMGEQVTYREYPGATHATVANDAVADVTAFFRASLSGPPPQSTC